MDPFELAQDIGMDYQRWLLEHMFMIAPAATGVARWLQSFKEFPSRQKPGSFKLERVMESVSKAHSGANQARASFPRVEFDGGRRRAPPAMATRRRRSNNTASVLSGAGIARRDLAWSFVASERFYPAKSNSAEERLRYYAMPSP
jgi:hypothetical protein